MKKSLKLVTVSSMLLASLTGLSGGFVHAENNKTEPASAEEVEESEEVEEVEESEESEESEEVEEESTQANESEDEASEEGESKDEATDSKIDWSEYESSIQETMKAKKIELLYESSEPREFEENDLLTSLDGYAYFKVEDFSRDFKIQYDQNDQGGVIVLKVRMENNSDEPVFFNNFPDITPSNNSAIIGQSDAMIGSDREDYLPLGIEEQEIAPGESLEGIITYYVGPDAMESIEADGSALMEFVGFRNQSDFMDAEMLLENPEFLLPLSEDAEEIAAASGEQYPDTIVKDNIGTKNVIEQEDTDAAQEEEDLEVKVSGYEISEIVPNSANEESFKEYPGGVIAINVKMDVQNNSEDQVVDLSGIYSQLVFGGQVQVSNNNSVEDNASEAVVEPGDEGTIYQVFTIDGDLWEKYKDDSLMIVPSIRDKDYEDMHDYQAIAIEFKK